jgi:gliding motility-associated-like protein
LINQNPFGTPDDRFSFGDPTEDFYMGTYRFNLCIEDILTKCRSCDTTKIRIVDEPTAYFATNPLNQTSITNPIFKMVNKSIDSAMKSDSTLSYVWDFGTGKDFSTIKNPAINYQFFDTGKYIITLYVKNNYGCFDTFSREIYIAPEMYLHVPNVFTPNSGGPPQNEIFKPIAINAKKYSLKIYTRWGEKIFETNNPSIGWDGLAYSGKMSQTGSYIYHIEMISESNKVYKYHGVVQLLR